MRGSEGARAGSVSDGRGCSVATASGCCGHSQHRDGAVVVAVVAVRMVQAARHQVVVMIAVRHLLVAALVVLALTGDGGAGGGVGRIDGDLALIDVVTVLMMQVAVVDVIDVA